MTEVSPLIDVEIATDGTAWVSCGGGINGTYPSSLWHFKLVGNQLTTLGSVCFGDAIKGFSIDASGNAWVASQKDDTIYAVAPRNGDRQLRWRGYQRPVEHHRRW